MQMHPTEFVLLRVLADIDGDRGEYVSLERLHVALLEQETVPPRETLIPVLRRLHRRRFVSFAGGDSVEITDMGIAALKSM